MAEDKTIAFAQGKEVSEVNRQSPTAMRVPQYRRDIFPTNAVVSAHDLVELCQIVSDANERAKNIEFNNLDVSKFESPEQGRNRVNELVRVEYNYVAANSDSVQGLGIPKVDDQAFPEELRSFFVSNASYTRRAINVAPLNIVDAFLSFEKPSLKIDVQTFPSNPTTNKSVINVMGRDEDWVISTASRIEEFLKHKKVFRPVIHGPGTYDYFVYLAFLPALIWLLLKRAPVNSWLASQPVFLNVILGIYVLLISLLFARFIFQYFRWLFPPMEFYKTSRVGAYTHRIIAGAILIAIISSAGYDLLKTAFFALW